MQLSIQIQTVRLRY